MAEWNARANDVFLRAAEVESPAERRVFLDQQCGDDAGLRAQVEALLAASEKVGSFLNRPAVQALPGGRGTADYEPIAERPGTVIGPYKLMEQIGEGGMGLVFVAEQQQPVRRRVALKIIKPGMDSKQVIARFEAERQALAMMDHLNIARVLDAGTTESGRPYFVMELVHGVPITDYCDANKLTPRERLELFVPVCHAIQHAHQKGIIHRDVKPSNILVTMYDDRPVPKVIDFGVAKAVEQRLTEKTIYTQYGTLVGTFEYMSPEQAEMNAFGVDTRSDVYALGVLLYELLTGTTPLERARIREAALGEVVRLIREEEPQRPSVRLSTSGALAKVAAARQTDPAKLSRLMRGELDWVVMKCLEKDRARRYETASGLARDVERYLKDEPVEARPPTATYKLRKLFRRNKVAVLTTAFVAAALVLGTAVSTWQAIRATQAQEEADRQRVAAVTAREEARSDRDRALAAEQRAQSEKTNARATLDFLRAEILLLANPEIGADPDVKLRTVVDQIAEKLDKESKQPPLVEAAVRYTVGALFMDLGRLPEAYRHLNRSYEIYQKERGERHEDTIRCMLRLGGLTYRHLRSPEEAERIVRRAWGLAREVLGPDHLTTLIAMRDMALLHTAQGRMQEGEDLLEQFRAGCVRTRGEADTWSVTALVFLAFHYLWQGKSDRAEEYATRAVELRRKHQGADHYLTLFAEQALAVTHISQDRFDQAEALYRHIAKGMRHHLGENSFGELTARAFLGLTLSQQGKHEEAVAVLREVIPLLRQRQSDGWLSFPLWSSLTNLGESLNRLARFEEAEPVLREALKIRLITFGSTKRRYHYSQSNLGETLTGLKRFQDAEGQLLAARKGLLTPQSIPLDERWRLRDESATLERLVRLYDAWSKPDEAAKWRKELEARKAAGKKP